MRIQRSRPALGIWVQDLYTNGVIETAGRSGRIGNLAAAIEGGILRPADGIAVIHDRFRRFVVDALGVPGERVRTIRNWSHVAPPREIDVKKVRSALGWSSDVTIVLHAGNMGAKQGLSNVIDAARAADRLSAPIKFVLLGDGNQRESLQREADGSSRVEFIRPLPDAEYAAALRAADILLVNERPGLNESAVPSKLTSYYSSGRPVLAAVGVGSITAQEIESSAAGVVVPAGDPEALVQAAIQLRNRPGVSDTLGASGRAFAKRELSEQAAIEKFEDWLYWLMEARRANRRGTKGA
ncbi:hypothetical protein GCM10022262_23890 [Georgenia daeguensis]|uniref:Glycosyltransferase n=1 Tax=Georgenia daeguensis TaxID=908355 RepID=A0ABP8EVN4_9MICO